MGMANGHMKGTQHNIIKKMKIKIVYYYTPTRMPQIQNTHHILLSENVRQ